MSKEPIQSKIMDPHSYLYWWMNDRIINPAHRNAETNSEGRIEEESELWTEEEESHKDHNWESESSQTTEG